MDAVERLAGIKQYTGKNGRAPHKPLLILMALGRLAATGSSRISWTEAEAELGELLAEFGTSDKARPEFPFTRLRTDGLWQIDAEVDNDSLTQLRATNAVGHLTSDIERQLLADPRLLASAARGVVERQFPMTIASDVLIAAGLDPDTVFEVPAPVTSKDAKRKRDSKWPGLILAAWNRSCAFCGYDGRLGSSAVAIEAAHIQWFNFNGPDSDDNGLALCSLHHKLLDRGVIGFEDPETLRISKKYAAVSEIGQRVYELAGHRLRPVRADAKLPAEDFVAWHATNVFHGESLSA